jgi:thiamine biosynthesis lipoprotein
VGGVEVLDLAHCSLHAMGTDVHVLVVDGDDGDLHWAHDEIERLEGRWSRFRADSDVARINRRAGAWVEVAPETVDLLAAAVEAWHRTAGAFDPLLGASLAALGYDRSFEQIDRSGAGRPGALTPPARQAADLDVDEARSRARVAPGRVLDLGGIAKGWTADRIVSGLLARGAAGACANLGGDAAVAGRAPHDDGWYVAVEHSAARAPAAVLAIPTGGVATSTTLRRRWSGPDGGHRHHLVDPRHGMPCQGALVEVTVVASSAARAEVLTKVAFVAPPLLGKAMAAGEAALLTTAEGDTQRRGDLGRLRPARGATIDAG